jgi:ABC-type nitrate/sulfonate/bicarbonate transport system substrate-binding protein
MEAFLEGGQASRYWQQKHRKRCKTDTHCVTLHGWVSREYNAEEHMPRSSGLIVALTALLFSVPAPAADIVNVANVSRTLFSLPFWVAQHRGFLKEEGLETTSNILDNAEKINAALRAGTMQIAMGTPEAVIIDAYKGGSLRLIAGNTGKLPHFIIARPHIKTLKDLRGANFGVLSEKEGSTYVVQDIAKAIGLTPADYRITVVGGAPTRWKLLQAGKIDVGLQPFPLSYVAEDAGFTNLGSVIPFVPDWQFTTINADMTWAMQNRDVVVRFLRAVQRGRNFMRTNPHETAEIASQELKTTVALATRAMGDAETMHILDPNLAVTEPGLRKVVATLQLAGDIAAAETFNIARFADLSFWEASRATK